jgi:hypothetical protein
VRDKIYPIRSLLEQAVDKMTNEEIGERFRWYIKEANHSGWEGYSGRDRRGCIALLVDIYMWFIHYK